MERLVGIIILSCFISLNSRAGKLEKAFQALDIYNYFDAKVFFEKSLKKDEVAACYGLSIIYYRADNPFFNIDSAQSYIIRSATNYSALPEKKKLKYEALKVDSTIIYEQRSKIGTALFERAVLTHTVLIYQNFIDQNPWSEHVPSAINFRDQLAFEMAQEENKSAAFASFIKSYPQSDLLKDAQSAYERLNYQEQTVTNNFIDYVSFIKNFPNSPYRSDAEDQVYLIYTRTGSLEAYKNFIATYPENRNTPAAWKKMFNTYLQNDYSSASIQAFMEEFPDYPFQKDVADQLERVERVLFPIKNRNKWGYIDEKGEVYISTRFESAEPFYEGLAIVALDGKYGFVDKAGDLVIDAIYDDAYRINEGHAVVAIEDKWGLVNRSGEFVIQPIYDDLGNLTEGFCFFAEGENYGYFDRKGIVRLRPQYTAAEDFLNGQAIVSSQESYGLIDEFGTTSIPFLYERLVRYNDTIYAALFDDLWGLLSEKGDTIVPFSYDFIGRFYDGRAIVERNDQFNYIKTNGELLLVDWLETYPEYRQLAIFENGYARIEFEKGYNLMDVNGKKLFATDKADVGFFSDFIAVKKGDKWGYVAKSGAALIDYNYTAALSFKGGFAMAGGAPLVGLINKRGEYEVEPYFERIEFFNDSILITKSRGNFGLLETNGDTLLDFKYVKIEPFSENIVRLETKEAIFYYSLRTNKFIRKEEE